MLFHSWKGGLFHIFIFIFVIFCLRHALCIHACGFMCVCVCRLYMCVFVYVRTSFVGMDSLASIAKDIVLEQHVYDRDLVSYSRSRALSLDHTGHHLCEHEMLSVRFCPFMCLCLCIVSLTRSLHIFYLSSSHNLFLSILLFGAASKTAALAR